MTNEQVEREPIPTDKIKDISHMSDLVSTYKVVRAELKAKEEELAAVRKRIEREMGNHWVGTVDGVEALTWGYRKHVKFDAKKFAAENPALHAEYTRTGSTRYFVVK